MGKERKCKARVRISDISVNYGLRCEHSGTWSQNEVFLCLCPSQARCLNFGQTCLFLLEGGDLANAENVNEIPIGSKPFEKVGLSARIN
jgi:hypothetical protein